MPIASSLLNKPRLVEKLRKFYDYVQKNDGKVGTKTRGIDLNFNNACNLRCKYCFTNSPKGDHVKEYLDIGAIRKLADEADELGLFRFVITGGEALLDRNLGDLITTLDPLKHLIILDTNGYFFTEEKARWFSDLGGYKVQVSLDGESRKPGKLHFHKVYW